MTGDFLRTSEAHCVCRCSFVLMSFVQKIEKYQKYPFFSFFFCVLQINKWSIAPWKTLPFSESRRLSKYHWNKGFTFYEIFQLPILSLEDQVQWTSFMWRLIEVVVFNSDCNWNVCGKGLQKLENSFHKASERAWTVKPFFQSCTTFEPWLNLCTLVYFATFCVVCICNWWQFREEI